MSFVPVVLVVLGALGVHDEAVVPIVHVVLVVRGAFGMQDEPAVPVVLVGKRTPWQGRQRRPPGLA